MTNGYGIDPERMYPTIFPEDEDARRIWHEVIGVPLDRIVVTANGREDNWWSPGPTGPNGPCSEVHMDRGRQYGKDYPVGRPGDDVRYLEVWNLVFMEFSRSADGTNVPLEQKNIDTGMGLERLAIILQDAPTFYETDLASADYRAGGADRGGRLRPGREDRPGAPDHLGPQPRRHLPDRRWRLAEQRGARLCIAARAAAADPAGPAARDRATLRDARRSAR